MVEKIYVQRFLSDGSLNENEADITCLPLRSYNDSHIAVTNIEGLAPMPGTINMDDNAGGDGSIFNSARAQNRNIVITMKPFEDDMYDFDGRFIPNSMEACRRKIYLIFPLKKKVRLHLETDTRKYYIDGYVETINADYFGELEGAQVSILCPDPYFKAEVADADRKLDIASKFYAIDLSPNGDSNYFLDHDIPMVITAYITKDIDGTKDFLGIGCGPVTTNMEYMEISKINLKRGDRIVINTKSRTANWIGERDGRTQYRNALPYISFNSLSTIDYFEYYIPGNNPSIDVIGKHRLLFNNWFVFDKDAATKFIFYAATGGYVSNTYDEYSNPHPEEWMLDKYYALEGEYYVLLDLKPEGWDDPESNEYYENYYIKDQFAWLLISPILEYEGV